MVTAHYGKRVLESLFVHIFSRPSIPVKQVYLNFAHYWLIFGGLISSELCYFYKPPVLTPAATKIWLGLFTISEIMNGACHLHLRSLRTNKKEDTEGENKRKIPYGYGFNQISCANYFWETTAWFSFAMLTQLKTCKC